MALLDDIEAFLEAREISATALGQQALGDRHFVRQLRMGRRVWPETEAKVRQFMEDFVLDHGDSNTATTEELPTGQCAPMSGETGAVA